MERLRKEYAAAEAEYNEAIKNGAVLPEAPKRGRRAGGAGKGAGFFDVVKKAQSSLWEDKFKAFKEKQRENASVRMGNLHVRLMFDPGKENKIYLLSSKDNRKISKIAKFGWQLL